MAIHNEAVDEDLEHFEDVPDETDNLPAADAKTPQSNDEDNTNGDGSNNDNDSSEDEEAPLASSSEDDEVDEDADLFPIKNIEKPQEFSSTKLSNYTGNQHHEASTKHSLPGGYDPRHREPSFWYILFTSFRLKMITVLDSE